MFHLAREVRAQHGLEADPAKSVVRYSRDAVGPEVFKLLEVVQAIGQGSFHPDVTRSGRCKSCTEAL